MLNRLRRSAMSTINDVARLLERSSRYSRAAANEAILHLARPSDLTWLTVQAYDRNPHYLDETKQELFPWEAAVVSEFFPKPPARILVGACGGGREMGPLAELGYNVAGFDPGPALVAVAGKTVSPERLVDLEVGTYEDLIANRSAMDGHGPFDAVILGWGSLSHLGVASTRRDLLRKTRSLCPTGPVLLSWVRDDPGATELRIRKGLATLGIHTRAPNIGYTPHGGFSRSYSYQEIFELAAQTDYRVQRFDEGSYPHALLSPRLAP